MTARPAFFDADALAAGYPTLPRLMGSARFYAAAADYCRTRIRATAADTAAFETFLAHSAYARVLPGVADVARLDRLCAEAQHARDEAALDAGALHDVSATRRDTAVLYPHAAARWAWFGEVSVLRTWASCRPQADEGNPILRAAAPGVLFTRVHGTVRWHALDRAGHALMALFAGGGTYAQAAALACDAQHDADPWQFAVALLAAGAFNRVSFARPRRDRFIKSFKNKYLS